MHDMGECELGKFSTDRATSRNTFVDVIWVVYDVVADTTLTCCCYFLCKGLCYVSSIYVLTVSIYGYVFNNVKTVALPRNITVQLGNNKTADKG